MCASWGSGGGVSGSKDEEVAGYGVGVWTLSVLFMAFFEARQLGAYVLRSMA